MNNFVILGSNRVGSTFLRESLDSHSKISLLDEFFCWNCEHWTVYRNAYLLDMGLNPADFNRKYDCSDVIESIFKKHNGFKIHRDQFSINNPSWKYISNYSKIIFLYRNNKIKQFISLKKAQSSKTWHYREEEKIPKGKKIVLDLNELKSFLLRESNNERRILDIISSDSSNMIKISYEELIQDPNGYFSLIQNFLKVKPERLRTSLKRINKKTIKQNILNYEELANILKGTKNEFMIYE